MIATGLRNMMLKANFAVAQNGMFAAQAAPLRNFAKKAKKTKKTDEGAEVTATEEEDAPVARETAEPVKAAPAKAASSNPMNLDAALFQPWSAGNIPVITSVEDHKCPVQEGTIEGRYASVLFTAAS
jgi:hypothetical protein